MRQRDVEINLKQLRWKDGAPCVVTGAPASIRGLTLRWMYFLGGFWAGQMAQISLPVSKNRVLVFWQYLRMLRWVFAAVGGFALLSLTPGGQSTLLTILRLSVVAVGFSIVWFSFGVLLKRYEFVRLVWVSRDRTKVRIRFSHVEYAERARNAMADAPVVDTSAKTRDLHEDVETH
jgi:hypothetical protein